MPYSQSAWLLCRLEVSGLYILHPGCSDDGCGSFHSKHSLGLCLRDCLHIQYSWRVPVLMDHPWYCGDGGKRIYTGNSQVSARSVYVLLIASCLSLLGDWVMQLSLAIQTSATPPNPWESFKFYKQKESKHPLAESSRLASFFPKLYLV